jgi:hypothetical protein
LRIFRGERDAPLLLGGSRKVTTEVCGRVLIQANIGMALFVCPSIGRR